jgi:hypothetical protein
MILLLLIIFLLCGGSIFTFVKDVVKAVIICFVLLVILSIVGALII